MRNIFFLIVTVSMVAAVLLLLYISQRTVKIVHSRRPLRHPKRAIVPALLVWLACFFVLERLWGMVNVVLILLHLGGIWLLCDGLGALIGRFRRFRQQRRQTQQQEQPQCGRRYYAGAVAIVLTIIHLSIGTFLNFHVWQTDYRLYSDKVNHSLRIALIADVHLGNTFDGEGFAEHLKRIEEQKPDLLVIAGDFVDDDSRKEDLLMAARSLQNFRSTYGVYYTHGNHDRGYFRGRDFSAEELIRILQEHQVQVMEDSIISIGEDYQLVGRLDKSYLERRSMELIRRDLDPTKYSIVIDHQPQDYEEQERAGVDLVLSGHTHGGQFFPFNQVGEWTGTNDQVYGLERRGQTDFCVTSGISCWALLFKTGCFSEYVILEINP
ncbi:MAG: metallophosphoesterase [Eubacteriales bacterium]|nr:metallophosphoesterase [Eubacteriales bacterium]